MRAAGAWLAIVVLAAGCGGSFPGVEGGFETVEVRRTPGAWFNLRAREALEVSIRPADDGGALLTGTVSVAGDPEQDECVAGAILLPDEWECVAAAPVERDLTAAEVETLIALLSAVPGESCLPGPGRACDDPVLVHVAVDGRDVVPDCCGERTNDFQQRFAEAVDYVDGLAAEGLPEE